MQINGFDEMNETGIITGPGVGVGGGWGGEGGISTIRARRQPLITVGAPWKALEMISFVRRR